MAAESEPRGALPPPRVGSRSAGLAFNKLENGKMRNAGAYLKANSAQRGLGSSDDSLNVDTRAIQMQRWSMKYWLVPEAAGNEGQPTPFDSLNSAFDIRNAVRYRRPLRVSTTLFILVNFLFVVYDVTRFGSDLSVGSTFFTVLLLRLVGLLPAALGLVLFTYSSFYRTHSWICTPFIFALGALTVTYSVVGDDPGYGTLALMITVLFSFSPVYFWWSVVLSALFVVGLGIGIGLSPPAAFDDERAGGNVVIADIFGTLAIFLVAVAFAGRNLDLQLRRSFMDEYKLRAESDLITAEQERSTTLLNSMLPASIQKKLRRAQASGRTTLADDYDGVTVLFCEIYQFAAWCADKKPEEVVRVLNTVYSTFDGLLDSFQDGAVHKVETVGEVYMLVSGAPKRTLRHAEHAANMALAMVASLPDIRDSISLELGLDASDLHVRVGLNSGSIMAGVTGLTQPRFKLFGDTVNTASRMESTSLPDRIQTTPYTAQLLRESLTPFKLRARGGVEVKGKGTIETFWLFGRGRILPKGASAGAQSSVHAMSEADFADIGSNERSPLSAGSSTAARSAAEHAIEQMIAESDAVYGQAGRLPSVGVNTAGGDHSTPTNGLLGPRAASANSTWSSASRPDGGSDSRMAELPAIMLAAPSLQDMSATSPLQGTPVGDGHRPATHVGVVEGRQGTPEGARTGELQLQQRTEGRGIKLQRSASERNTTDQRSTSFSPGANAAPFDFAAELKVSTAAAQRPPRPEASKPSSTAAKGGAATSLSPRNAIPVSYRTHARDSSGLAAAPELDLDILTEANQGTGALTSLVVAAKLFSPRTSARNMAEDAGSPVNDGASRRGSDASAAATAVSRPNEDDASSVDFRGSSARSEAQAVLEELGVRPAAQSGSGLQSSGGSVALSGRSTLPPIQHSARGKGLAKDGFVADESSDAREARFEASLRAELAAGSRTGRTDGGVFGGTSRSAAGASGRSFSQRSARSDVDAGGVEEYLAELNPEHAVGGWGMRRESTGTSDDTGGEAERQSSDTALRPAAATSPAGSVALDMQAVGRTGKSTAQGTLITTDETTASASVVAPDVSAGKAVGQWRVEGAPEGNAGDAASPTSGVAGLAAAASASWAEQDLDDDDLSVTESPAALPSSVPYPGTSGAVPSPDTDAGSTGSSSSSVLGKAKVHPVPPRHVVLSVPSESKAARAGGASDKSKRSSAILKQQSRSTTALVRAKQAGAGGSSSSGAGDKARGAAKSLSGGSSGLAKLRKVASGAAAAKTMERKGAQRRDPRSQFSQLCLYRAPKDATRAAHAVESAFVLEQSKLWRRFARISTVGALVASVLFLLYDSIRLVSEDDEFRNEIWPKLAIVRYGVLMPVLLVYLAFTFTRKYRKDHDVAQWATGAALLLVGGCIIATNILGRNPGYGVLALFIVYSLNISLLAYLWRVLIFSTLVVAYILTVSLSGSIVDIPIDTVKVSTDFIYLLVFFFGQALPVFAAEYHLRHNFLRRIQLRRARAALHKEQERSSQLLSNLLPPTIVSQLKAGRELIADFYPEATVLFTDLRGFTAFSSTVTPAQLVAFLNVLFSTFDRISTKFGVHKVELIGDAYFGVTGVPGAAADQSERAANMGLEMLMHMPAMRSVAGSDIKMRVGVHTGPVIAGVVGRKDPRYHLFGETVDVAMGMESSGIPDRIQVSQAAYERLMRRQYLRTIRYLRTLAVIAEIRAYAAARAQEHTSSAAAPTDSSDALQLVESAVSRNQDAIGAVSEDVAAPRAPQLVIGQSMHSEGAAETSLSPPQLSSPVPGLDLANGRIRARSSHALEESEDHSSVLKAAGGYFRKGSDELRVPTRSNLPLSPPDIALDLPRDLLAWMYFAQPLTHEERTLDPVTDDQANVRQGAHTDITQVWSQKTGNFLGFDVEGSSVLTCSKHPLLLHTLGDGECSESVLHTISHNTLPSLEAPSPESALQSAGTMATGKTIRPKRDRYDDPSWLVASKAESASSVARVGDLLGGTLDAASLVATTRMEVREEIAYSAAASSKTANSMTPPITAHLALVAGLKDFEDPSSFLQKTFFGRGGGFFAFTYRGTQTVKGVGDEHTYMLTRALPCGLDDTNAASQ